MIKLLYHEDTGTMLLQNIRNHLLNDTHNLSVVTMCRSYLVTEKFTVWQQCWCLATVRRSCCLFLHLQLNKGLRMTARMFLMYELFISCLGKHHDGVMISRMKGCAIMLHHMELFAGG